MSDDPFVQAARDAGADRVYSVTGPLGECAPGEPTLERAVPAPSRFTRWTRPIRHAYRRLRRWWNR